MKNISFLLLIISSLSFPTAYAESVNITSFGKWVNPQSSKVSPVFNGTGTNYFSWGVPSTSSPGSTENALKFEGLEFNFDLNKLEEKFKLGTVSFKNGTVATDTSVDFVSLDIHLNINEPDFSFASEFTVRMVSTKNDDDDPQENADYIYFTNTFSPQSFTAGEFTYVIEIIGFSDDSGKTIATQFHVLEEQTASTGVYARVVNKNLATISEAHQQLIVASGTTIEAEVDANNQLIDSFSVITPALTTSNILIRTNTIQVSPITTLLLSPPMDNQSNSTIKILSGGISMQVICGSTQDGYDIETQAGTVSISGQCDDVRRSPSDDSEFKVDYSVNGLTAALKINVLSGQVVVTDRNGDSTTLSAAEQKNINSPITHSEWLLPIDGDFIYGGRENTLVWTSFPTADRYVIEYTFPPPYFSEETPSQVEFSDKTVVISEFETYQNLIIYRIPLNTGWDDSIVQARIFAVDKQNRIIENSNSSDTANFTWSD